MSFSFPTSPTTGQQYAPTGGPTYTWNGTAWQVLTPGQQFAEQQFTATAGQTTFTVAGGYVIGGIDVYRNGVKLLVGSDFTATDLSTVVLTNACSAGDMVECVSISQILYSQALKNSNNLSDVSNAATALSNLGGLPKAGGTMTGAITQVADAGGTVQFLRGRSSDNLAQIGIRNNADTAWIGLLQFAGDGSFIWNSGSGLTQRFSVDPNGLLTLSAGQIKFPATQNPSSDANTLDDYEEGTWTPAFTGSVSNPTLNGFNSSGYYTKVGNLVTLSWFATRTSSSGGSGTFQLVGLPFTSGSVSSMPFHGAATVESVVFGASAYVTAMLGGTSATITFAPVTNNSTFGYIQCSALNGGAGWFAGSISYRTA